MELSPEERRKIYEEEKARIEQEQQDSSGETSVGMPPRIAGWLCYLGVWISGIIFFFVEQKNQWIRFHAAQSVVVFGTLAVAGALLGWIPFIGPAFSTLIGLAGFILWIVLQVKAYNGQRFKLAWAGDIAEMMIGPSVKVQGIEKPAEAPPEEPGKKEDTVQNLDKQIHNKIEEFFQKKRGGRITLSAFGITWGIILLVFFNFFHKYVAYYHAETANGVVTWTRQSFFTSDIYLWLPVLTVTLVISIACYIVLIIFDKYVLRQVLRTIMDVFGLAVVVSLLAIFPFDFSMLPTTTAAAGTEVGVTVVLVCISAGFGIGIIVRMIKLLVNLIKGTADYHKAV
jgi:uncharacterized membrane protein